MTATVSTPVKSHGNKKWTPLMQAQAEVAAACGVSLAGIGRALGAGRETVRRHLMPKVLERHRERQRQWRSDPVNAERWRERQRQRNRQLRRREPLLATWQNMLTRCNNPRNKDFAYYGGRGIRVHPEWRRSFESFKDYVLASLGTKPGDRYSINRINNDGNYEPGNIEWATVRQQNNNARKNVLVQCDDCERLTLAQACDVLGVNYKTASRRVGMLGWDPRMAVQPGLPLGKNTGRTMRELELAFAIIHGDDWKLNLGKMLAARR